jgi:acetylcholinesterase
MASFGQSAGAMSISMQMLGFDGNTDGLFRAAFMMSGAPIAVGDITLGQKYYDALVDDAGCSYANDTLGCLRDVPYPKLKAAINKSPDLFSYQVNGDYPNPSKTLI